MGGSHSKNSDDYFDSARDGASPFSDFEWFALDRNGHVAILTAAGEGVIPRAVFRSREAYFLHHRTLLSLPRTGTATRVADLPGDLSFWTEAAERGLYGYDWTNHPLGTPGFATNYVRVAVPASPITVNNLDEKLRTWLEAVRLPALTFAEAEDFLP